MSVKPKIFKFASGKVAFKRQLISSLSWSLNSHGSIELKLPELISVGSNYTYSKGKPVLFASFYSICLFYSHYRVKPSVAFDQSSAILNIQL